MGSSQQLYSNVERLTCYVILDREKLRLCNIDELPQSHRWKDLSPVGIPPSNTMLLHLFYVNPSPLKGRTVKTVDILVLDALPIPSFGHKVKFLEYVNKSLSDTC